MKLKAGYWYYFVTALIFWGVAFWIKFVPAQLGNIPGNYREIIFWVFLIWGAFRGFSGYLSYQKARREANED